jgi:hypothetical protein
MANSRLAVEFPLVLSAADAKSEAPAARSVDAGWAGACEAVANSTFRSVEPQYVSVGHYSGRTTFPLWFESARQGNVHWQHSDFVEDLNYHCEGFDIYLDPWNNRAIGTLNPKSDGVPVGRDMPRQEGRRHRLRHHLPS